MLVWNKGSIKKTVSVLQYCVILLWCTKVRAVRRSWSTVSGFDLASFSFLFSKCLCVFGLHGAKYIVQFFAYIVFFIFSELSLVVFPLDLVD